MSHLFHIKTTFGTLSSRPCQTFFQKWKYIGGLNIYPLLLTLACSFIISCQQSGNRHHVEVLIGRSEQLLEAEQPDSSWTLLEEAYRYAENGHDASALADVCLAMSRNCNILNMPDSAISWLNHGLAAYPDAQDSLLAQYYGEISATYNILGDMRKSVDYGLLALPLMRKYASAEDFAIACGNIGISYRRLGQNDSSAILYHQGLEVAMRTEDYESQAYLANNLSVLYCEMGRYEESIHYAGEAALAAQRTGDNVERLSAEANKGIALLLDKQPDKAIKILQTSFQQADSTNSLMLKLKITNYLLKALTEKKQWNEADIVLQKGQELAKQLPSGSTAAAGILEAKMIGQTERQQYADALTTIEQIEQLMAIQQVLPLYKLLSTKARCMAGLGRYYEAYQLQTAANSASDSVYNKVNTDKLNQLTTDYRVMQKELQLSRQQIQSQRKTSLLVAAISLLIVLLGGMLLWIRQRHQKAHMRETKKYVEGIEQERTRFAHELHDGACNELLSIGIQLRQDNKSSENVVKQLATLRAQLRNLSHELMPPQFTSGVSLHQALEYYLTHLDKPTINFHAKGDEWEKIPVQTAYQIYRIVQEAIGNVITHQPEAWVDVSLLYNNEDATPLRLTIASKGPVQPGDGTGIGLRSMRDRASSVGMKISFKQSSDSFTLTLF